MCRIPWYRCFALDRSGENLTELEALCVPVNFADILFGGSLVVEVVLLLQAHPMWDVA